MNEYDDQMHGDDGADEYFDGIGEGALDYAALTRVYEIALADFRLDRANWIVPCVAAVVNASFTLFDPVGLMPLCQEGAVAHRYDGAAVRVWDALCSALYESVGEEDGFVTVGREQIVLHLWTCLLAEFDGSHTSPCDEPAACIGEECEDYDECDEHMTSEHDALDFDARAANSAMFAAIIGDEFGAEAAQSLRGAQQRRLQDLDARPGMVDAAGLTINGERVRAMADAIYARCGRLPLVSPAGE